MAKKKSILLSKKVEWIYYIVYIALSLSIRKDLFISNLSYLRILSPVILGVFTLFIGISAIKEGKIVIVSRMYKDKSVLYVGIILIIVSIYIMFFFK